MTIEEAYIQIDKYLDSNSHRPIVVDVTDGKLMTLLVRRYDVKGKNEIISAGVFCKGDNMPLTPNLKHAITTSELNVFLTDYSTYLKLLGKEELQMQLKSLLTDTIVGGKLVIFTYNCRKYMDLFDKRLTEAKKIIFVGDETKDIANRIYLVASKLPFVFDSLDKYADGLSQLPPFIEKSMLDEENVFVKTSYKKGDFQQALLDIREVSSSYEVIISFCDSLKMIEKKNGTECQWDKLLTLLQDEDFNWIDLVHKKIGSKTVLANNLFLFNNYSDIDKWIYFLALKCFGTKENNYLTKVIVKSNNLEQFISELYDSILDMDSDDSNFPELYKERKILLSHFPENSNALISYCKKVTGKDKFTLYYLTDATKLEKELIIKCIGDFSKEYCRTKMEQVLQSIYPALYSYLSPYNYGNKFNEYFDLYKYSKIVNEIDEKFAMLSEEQIAKHDFLMEPTRAFIIDKIDKKNTYLYFMDAMGVEFLSYIQGLCYKHHLEFSAQIGRCNLPSITIHNKEFIADFTNSGCQYSDVKDLDEIKHDDQLDYDYEKVKQPIHLAEELSILDKVIAKVDSQLQQGNLEKVVLASDHGASRMAVIAESENKWEMTEKGQHSGRCCPVTEIDEKPSCSIEENEFWCLLNYDRFKGSRKANVEVHGGASLEEVLVPIIEITKHNQTIECRIENDYKVITSSFKKKTKIKFYISKTFENVSILVDSKFYYSANKEMGKDYIYEVEMPDVKKSGIHTFDVLVDNGLITKGLSFELKKEGASERKFF
jgi:hypothetical protein